MLTSPVIPQIHSIMVSDWLPKLGEKAFLTWLRLHSWKKETSSPDTPFSLSLSLNKIIKQLKMGKNTFYEKVLRPLLHFGLIELKPKNEAQKETHLIIYSYPENNPENAHSVLQASHNLEPEAPQAVPSDYTSDHDHQPYPPEDQEDPQENNETTPVLPPEEFPSEELPLCIEEAMNQDHRLRERSNDIIQVYHQCRADPRFDLQLFHKKLITCINYSHDPKRFGAYLLKAIHNEWKLPQHSISHPIVPFSPSPSTQQRPRDVPEWVWKQQQGLTPPNTDKLSPEQQAIADRLLRELGELG
ncbi:hypothetical protein [Ammoniphilus sp. YIM 78166]|uniref:hypothetical protein n=1 Tax=Ammoniphilus sp. YIM 78166 TaxID=1644106 RepID=UPI001070569F|nr:hypothetical protein [Ammoniphilus sp. YIM 78166]